MDAAFLLFPGVLQKVSLFRLSAAKTYMERLKTKTEPRSSSKVEEEEETVCLTVDEFTASTAIYSSFLKQTGSS